MLSFYWIGFIVEYHFDKAVGIASIAGVSGSSRPL
jgi:hypothetical protein